MTLDTRVDILIGKRSRLAMRFEPTTIRRHLPKGVVGSYLLLEHETPVYVGRSDTCLRHRLERHPLLGHATHVAWEATCSAQRAFHLEAFWFHQLKDAPHVRNDIHPARPAGSDDECPYCTNTNNEAQALHRALAGDHESLAHDSGAHQHLTMSREAADPHATTSKNQGARND